MISGTEFVGSLQHQLFGLRFSVALSLIRSHFRSWHIANVLPGALPQQRGMHIWRAWFSRDTHLLRQAEMTSFGPARSLVWQQNGEAGGESNQVAKARGRPSR